MEQKESSPTQIRFSQNLSLWQAIARGLGVALATMLFVLLGELTGSVGPLVPAAILLTALLVMLNSLGYTELAVGAFRPGGAYVLVHDSSGGNSLSFLTGWALILAGLGLCTLLVQGAARHLELVLSATLNTSVPTGLLGVGLLILLMLKRSLSTRRRQRLSLILPIVALIGILLLLFAYRIPDKGYTETTLQPGSAITLLLAAFIGIETIASHQQEIRRRKTNLPRAMLLTPALAAIAGIGIAAMLGPAAAETPAAPLAPLGEAAGGALGRTVILTIGGLMPILAAEQILSMVFRLLYTMGRDGFWPAWLWKTDAKRGIPARTILLTGLLIAPAAWIPIDLLSRTCGLLYLLVLIAVNFTLVRRLRGARSSFTLPFHPWVPALTIAVDVLVIPLWGLVPVICVAGCLMAGLVIYVAYARAHHIEAKSGVTVFRPPTDASAPDRFRVLVPIANPTTAGALLRTAGRLAHFSGGEILALQVVVVPEPMPLEAGQQRAQASRTILEKALAVANEQDLPLQTMTRAARSVARGILDTAIEEGANLILLGWQEPPRTINASMGRIADAVLRDAPCDVLVMRGEHAVLPQKILVSTAGGPHARTATELARLMMKALQAEVTIVHVRPQPASASQIEESRRQIAEMVDALSLNPPPEQRVVTAPSVVQGIIREAQAYDLVLLGVSEESLFDRVVFGTIPLQVAARVPQAALVQGYQGVAKIWTRRLLRALLGTLPLLNDEEQLDVQRELAREARPGINFFVLIVLSCIIAALGLLLNSPAVVIGAMLVAPLMSPILALSLGLITGDLRMIRFATEAVLKGIALAVIITAFIGLLSPLKGTTEEMIARSQPTLLDLAVALASGMAGAYALARKDVSAALPGVAIAAALMPPLATIGLGLSMGDVRVAGGALLLFITNIAAISLAAGVVFLLLGIRPRSSGPDSQRQLRMRLVASLLLLVVIAVPLGIIMAGIVQDAAREQATRETIGQYLATDDSTLVTLEIERGETDLLIVATIRSIHPLEEETVDHLAETLGERLGQPIQLEVVRLPIIRSNTTPGTENVP